MTLLTMLLACPAEPPTTAGGGGDPAAGQNGPPGDPGQGGAPGAGQPGQGEPGQAAPGAQAEPSAWEVDGSVSVVTLKDGSAEVPGGFSEVSGTFDIQAVGRLHGVTGQAVVDLESWDSENPVRDERIERTFFGIAKNPTATFDITGIEGVPDGGLAPGGSADTTVLVGTVTLNGAAVETRFPVVTTRYDKGFSFVSSEPAVVSIESFGMGSQLDALIKECAHQSVADEVKVSVDVTLGDITAGAKGGAGEGGPPPEGTEGGAPAAEAPAEGGGQGPAGAPPGGGEVGPPGEPPAGGGEMGPPGEPPAEGQPQ